MSTNYSMSITSSNVKRGAGSALVVILYDAFVSKNKKGSIIPEGEAGKSKGGKWMNSFKDGAVMMIASLLDDLYFCSILMNAGIQAMPAYIIGDGLLYSTGQYLRGKKKFLMNFLLGAGASYVGGLVAPYSSDKIVDIVADGAPQAQAGQTRKVSPTFAPAALGQPSGNLDAPTGF